jgi:hypothetical protein
MTLGHTDVYTVIDRGRISLNHKFTTELATTKKILRLYILGSRGLLFKHVQETLSFYLLEE